MSTVAATPLVPPDRTTANQRARMSILRHRRFVKAGLQPGNVELRLPEEFVLLLKRSWRGRSYYDGPHFVILATTKELYFFTTKELYFLRMLLNVVTSATCFEDLRLYRGVVHDSFKGTCQARGLVGDDNEWFLLFDESVQWASSYQLRHLFMTVMIFCDVTNEKKI